jgi:NUMOD3 motif
MVRGIAVPNHPNALWSISMIYLYVKQHISTGLKYFGMTRSNPFKYSGSGKYWKYHLKKHGKNIKTLEVWSFDDQDICSDFAIKFSEDNNIVESKIWANLQIENGLDGTTSGSKFNKTVSCSGNLNNFYGKTHSFETKEKIRKAKLGRKLSSETIEKVRTSNLGKVVSQETKNKITEVLINQPVLSCPHCGKSGKGFGPMKRHHFDNCKLKEVLK